MIQILIEYCEMILCKIAISVKISGLIYGPCEKENVFIKQFSLSCRVGVKNTL